MSTASAAARLPVVVVPVFNALAALDACLDALDRTLPAGTRVHLADDASTDPRVPELLAAWAGRSRLAVRLVRRPRNLGFPANCNAAFAETGDADLVLLNTDTVPAGDWLARLAACAAHDPRIASATPWSNHGEIVSFPHFVMQNPMPEDAEALAAARRILVARARLPGRMSRANAPGGGAEHDPPRLARRRGGRFRRHSRWSSGRQSIRQRRHRPARPAWQLELPALRRRR